MRARAVIGANFGDEGKGLVTDYLCSQGAGVVIRFNGGAQAGHTVVTPDGLRHVFHHFGSGTLLGVPTFLSQFFVCNPILFFQELEELINKRIAPEIYAHPSCPITTFADMMINQEKEKQRGNSRHGSCGVGVHETMQRSQVPHLNITMGDLYRRTGSLEDKLKEICGSWYTYRTKGGKLANADKMIHEFIKRCNKFSEIVQPAGMDNCKKLDPIFEGAQGLMLCQSRKEFWPHVTHSITGMTNVRELMKQGGFDACETYYVTRSYMTRHGAGPLPGHDPKMAYDDDTNIKHDFQGEMRFAPLDMHDLGKRCQYDCGHDDWHMVMTHCDQRRPTKQLADLYSFGPTRADIRKDFKEAAA